MKRMYWNLRGELDQDGTAISDRGEAREQYDEFWASKGEERLHSKNASLLDDMPAVPYIQIE